LAGSGYCADVATDVQKRTGNPISDFFSGLSFLLRGLGMYARSPRLMFLGLIPALISGVLLVGAFVAVIYFADDLARFVTPFANDWSSGVRSTVRTLVGIAIVGVWLVLSVLIFTALTLLIGEPFYEAISKNVEDRLGGVPNEVNPTFLRMLPRIIADSVRLVVKSAFLGVPIFLIGLIPAVGQITAAILGAMLAGWMLAIELTGVPFDRRGLRLRDRRRMLSERRSMALGFGTATFLCFLIPLGAVLVMPAAVAGATLLSRRLFGLPDSLPAGSRAGLPAIEAR
jgi:CysZ protein